MNLWTDITNLTWYRWLKQADPSGNVRYSKVKMGECAIPYDFKIKDQLIKDNKNHNLEATNFSKPKKKKKKRSHKIILLPLPPDYLKYSLVSSTYHATIRGKDKTISQTKKKML